MRRIGTSLAALAILGATACTSPEERDTAAGARTDAAESLPEGLIDRLKTEYAVLREEPAPEPKPGPDADPNEIPERVRRAGGGLALQTVTGDATFYADTFEGRRTASGIPFRQNQMVAAHRSFPFGTLLRVTNLRNERSVNVRVVDRGPHGGSTRSKTPVIDLSRRAASELGYVGAGRTSVRVEVLEWGGGLPRSG